MSNTFSKRLKELRGPRKKAEFSRFLGIPPPMYHRYEAGQIPKQTNLRVISDRCGVTIDWLLGREDAATAAPPIRLDAVTVREDHAPYSCRIPESCDLPASLAEIRSQMASMSARIDTLTRLLGDRLDFGSTDPCRKPGQRSA